MNQEASTIRAVVRALDGQEALVEVEQGGCGRCHEEGGCGGQQLAQMFCSTKTYRVENTIKAAVGDHVTVAIAAGSVRRTANLAYGIPLLAILLGALLGMQLAGDGGAVLGAGAGLLLSFFYVRHRSRGAPGNPAERPHIVSRS
ncbi:MAG: SoxR reducing system RseC family protein [Bacteroidota bacterium]